MNIKPNWCYLLLISLYFSVGECGTEDLSVIPTPDVAKSTLIYYNANNRSSVLKWTHIIESSLSEYWKQGNNIENRVQCTHDSWALGETQVCDVPVEDFHPCSQANQFNYHRATPCVFIKLGNILNWTPEPYNTTRDLPEDMPEDLKQHISVVSGKPEANTVWVTCAGENPADQEFIGPVLYIPRRGFPSYYYPFTNKEGYLNPLMAVYFERPLTGIVINVVCTAWAKNIDRSERRGQLHFELLVDN